MQAETLPRQIDLAEIIPAPRMGDCPQGGDHAWKAEKVADSIIYTCQKCGAGR